MTKASFRAQQGALRSGALRVLGAGIGVAGIVGTSAVVWVVTVDGTAARHVAWIAIFLASGSTVALVGCCLLAALALDLFDSKRKAGQALLRQRRHMLARTRALRESRKRYKELFSNVPAAVLLSDSSGTIIAANPAMLALLGIESERELHEANIREFYADPTERDRLMRDWDSGSQDVWNGELKLKQRDGKELNVICAARLVRDDRGRVKYKQGMFTDVTALRRAESERRALEMHLRLSQKLESVGRLAAGVAHEIYNPMQVLGDNVHFLKEVFQTLEELLQSERRLFGQYLRDDRQVLERLRELDQQAELGDLLDAVPGAFRRAGHGIDAVNRIVGALTELAHPKQGIKVRVDLNALIDTALVVTRNQYKTIANVETSYGDIPPVLAEKNELCHVFINLIVNGAHAIESAKRQDQREGVISIATVVEDGAVVVHVTDTGCGIPWAARDKIFDPFFTTKEVGRGTGQGLAIARNTVVDKHDGEICVESTPGAGSTFTIRLPIEQARVDAQAEVKEAD